LRKGGGNGQEENPARKNKPKKQGKKGGSFESRRCCVYHLSVKLKNNAGKWLAEMEKKADAERDESAV